MKKLKKKTKKFLVSWGILVAVFVVIILVRIFSGEDTWICNKGKWEKHGNPANPKPTAVCSQK